MQYYERIDYIFRKGKEDMQPKDEATNFERNEIS